MRQLTKEEASYFIRRLYEITNPIRPHEEKIIANILQTKNHQRDWRFKNHVFCRGCNRELSVLDMFLSGLNHHSPQYIHDYLYKGAPGGGETVYEDGVHPTIQVFTHGLNIVCINCGVENISAEPLCDYYGYKRPKKPLCTFSMSVYWYETFLEEFKQQKRRLRPKGAANTRS